MNELVHYNFLDKLPVWVTPTNDNQVGFSKNKIYFIKAYLLSGKYSNINKKHECYIQCPNHTCHI